jgi:hypothetical protein
MLEEDGDLLDISFEKWKSITQSRKEGMPYVQ